MPDPLAMEPIFIFFPLILKERPNSFALVSVVKMALAAPVPLEFSFA